MAGNRRFQSLLIALSVTLVPTLGAAQDSIIGGLDGPTWVKFGRDSVAVEHVDDSVTIVVYAQSDAPGPVNLNAQYSDGTWFFATAPRGVAPGQFGIMRIPWRPRALTIGRSRQLQLESGDIVLIRYPTDYGAGGWLARN